MSTVSWVNFAPDLWGCSSMAYFERWQELWIYRNVIHLALWQIKVKLEETDFFGLVNMLTEWRAGFTTQRREWDSFLEHLQDENWKSEPNQQIMLTVHLTLYFTVYCYMVAGQHWVGTRWSHVNELNTHSDYKFLLFLQWMSIELKSNFWQLSEYWLTQSSLL